MSAATTATASSTPQDEWTLVTRNDKRHVPQRRRRRNVGPGSLSTKTHNNKNNQTIPKLNQQVDTSPTNDIEDDSTAVILVRTIFPQQFDQCVGMLKSSNFYHNLKAHLLNLVSQEADDGHAKTCGKRHLCRLVCYGIGNFATTTVTARTTSFSASLWQLALLHCLLHDFDVGDSGSSTSSSSEGEPLLSLSTQSTTSKGTTTTSSTTPSTGDCNNGKSIAVYYYDPCTRPVEQELLTQTIPGIEILTTNDRGKIQLIPDDFDSNNDKKGEGDGDHDRNDDSGITLFYMPHCPMLLYEHVIWAHWKHFVRGRAILLGNSLCAYSYHRIAKRQNNGLPPCLATVCVPSPPPTMMTMTTTTTTTTKTKTCPLVREQTIPYSRQDVANTPGHFERAFNDLYLIQFDNEAANKAPGLCLDRPPEHMDDEHNDDDRELL